MSVDKSLMFPVSSQLSTAGTCRGGSESPGWGLGASLLCAAVPFGGEQGARPGRSRGKMRAEKTSPPFPTLRFCVSCCAGDTELCRLWASSERGCDRMEVLIAIPPGIVFEGFLKIALSRPAWFSWLHSRRLRRSLTRTVLRGSSGPGVTVRPAGAASAHDCWAEPGDKSYFRPRGP